MNRGKKTRKWDTIRAALKIEFERNNIIRCEMCNGNFALGFAHRYKRRFITTDEELRVVALLCTECHSQIEYSGHEEMKQAIDTIIAGR